MKVLSKKRKIKPIRFVFLKDSCSRRIWDRWEGVGGIEGRSVFLGLFKIGYIYKVFSFDAKD